ncbi:MAG: hypothetical protein WDN00_00670 [Limisphaerales bacterium]
MNENGRFATNLLAASIKPDFTIYNGYYVWPRTINEGGKISLSTDRRYMVTAETDDAIAWIQRQPSFGKPWMCTVSYSAIHTPYQQPPTTLYPPGFTWPARIPEGNTNDTQVKIVSNLMLYALDKEIGRLLVGAGLARMDYGKLQYLPEATDTMIIVCGDNGTYYKSVNLPYNPLRAKASPYQTGVSGPLIISGPMVRQPRSYRQQHGQRRGLVSTVRGNRRVKRPRGRAPISHPGLCADAWLSDQSQHAR